MNVCITTRARHQNTRRWHRANKLISINVQPSTQRLHLVRLGPSSICPSCPLIARGWVCMRLGCASSLTQPSQNLASCYLVGAAETNRQTGPYTRWGRGRKSSEVSEGSSVISLR